MSEELDRCHIKRPGNSNALCGTPDEDVLLHMTVDINVSRELIESRFQNVTSEAGVTTKLCSKCLDLVSLNYEGKIAAYCERNNLTDTDRDYFTMLMGQTLRARCNHLVVVKVSKVRYHFDEARDKYRFVRLAQWFETVDWSAQLGWAIAPSVELAASHLAFKIREHMKIYPDWQGGAIDRFTFRVEYGSTDKWGEVSEFRPTCVTTLDPQGYEVKNGEPSSRMNA